MSPTADVIVENHNESIVIEEEQELEQVVLDEGEHDQAVVIDETKQEHYRNWKLNSIHLYDYLNTNNLVWPSLTVQFFPDQETPSGSNSTKYRLLTSTYTIPEFPTHLQIRHINIRDQIEEVSLKKYDPVLSEFQSSHLNSSLKLDQSILHNQDINRARILPQNPNLISTINNTGTIHIFDKTKHPSNSSDDFKYEIRLNEHKQDGFGLSWNNLKHGLLLSSASDGLTKVWDITKFQSSSTDIPSLQTIKTDDIGTNDVQWNHLHDSIFSTVGEDNSIKIFDQRSLSSDPKAITDPQFHSNGINSLSFNFQNSLILSSVDSIGTINIWDLRNISKPSISLSNAHTGSISTVQFNPSRPNLLATGGAEDNMVNIWDFSKDDGNQLIFKHGGHFLGINELNWNPNDELMIASVSNDNTLHLWKPSKDLVV